MRYFSLILSVYIFISCNNKEEAKQNLQEKQKKQFSGNYNEEFNDLPDLHLAAAIEKGITPLSQKADTANTSNELVRIPSELALYKTDKLKHSIPYLVPDASKLLIDICTNFRDSLISKKIPLHKPILTSLTRTDEDIDKLTKRNTNAIHNSAHCYGTTFDISWKRYEANNPYDSTKVSIDKLKLVMGQVLSDLRLDNRCYVKHEKKQACFHITAR